MRADEAGVGLLAGHQRDAGRHAHHPQPGRQRLGQLHRGGLQRGLGQRVRQEVRVQVVELLVEQVDHHAALGGLVAIGAKRLVHLTRQQQRRGHVGAHVGVERGVGEARRHVVLEQRGVVDQAGRHAERVGAGGDQLGGGRFVGQVGLQHGSPAAQAADLRGERLGFVARAVAVDRHVPASRGKFQRDGTAQAACAAGHEGDAARGGRMGAGGASSQGIWHCYNSRYAESR
ncbi:hypothetical protein D3C87_1413460 [compost metagenome]